MRNEMRAGVVRRHVTAAVAGAAVAAALTCGVLGVAGAAPSPSAAARPATSHPATTYTKLKFKATYSGKIALLIDGTTVTGHISSGKGTATTLGKSTLTGSGGSSTSASCDPMTGTGSLTGSGSKLTLKILSSTQGCGTYPAPTKVTITGSAKVTSGVGKFKGATGTLTISGSFTLPSTTSNSTDSFTARLTGTLRVISKSGK